MKMSSFLFLSLALHAAALAYPALRPESRNLSPVVVTVIDADGGSGNGSKGEESAPGKKAKPSVSKALPEKRPEQPVTEAAPIAELPKTASAPDISPHVNGTIAVSIAQHDSPGAGEISSGSSGAKASGSGTGGTDGSGSGRGGSGTGSGDARGNGNGALPSVRASYDYCPRPEYSERLEGTVMLRVLVDEEGKPKSLKVNKSSGFAVLDQAAVEHVKQRCRFHPARYGDKRVESLVEFSVVFKLADLKH